MKRVMVRYRVKPDRVAENERQIALVFEQLRSAKPAGLRYASFKMKDGVSFVHLAAHETADGSNPLREIPAFQAFTQGIAERCDEPPVAVEVTEVGSYRFAGDE